MSAPNKKSRLKDFQSSLNETLGWCRKRFTMYDLAGSLRSKELAPQDQEGSINQQSDVEEVIAKRRQALPRVESQDAGRQGNWYRPSDKPEFRLLSYYSEETTQDGTSPPPTGGFLNGADCPPWDSWIWCHDDNLISIVPLEIESGVQLALECNSMGCIGWLGYREEAFATDVLQLVRKKYSGFKELPNKPKY